MVFKTDTIAAVATAMSDSGIGIVRVSGENAISIVDKLYVSKNKKKRLIDVKSHTIHYGFIQDQDVFIDEVMVAVMKAPNSYTTEDTVEINCHGGVLMVNYILETLLKYGARLAEPGEFTKRAFLNGRIDLSKAEAVIDVIHSKNEFALKASTSQLKGVIADEVSKMRSIIIYEIAFIESALDDPEHISLDGFEERISKELYDLDFKMTQLIDSADNGKILKEGVNTVILGKPNAGKSSLLNILVGEEKAIVTSIAGTTRDIIQENIKLHGIGLNIIDTAGIRDTEDIVEKIGVEKALKCAETADLIIHVVDCSIPLDESDLDIMRLMDHKKAIILLNKTDLNSVLDDEIIQDCLKDLSIPSYDLIPIIKTSTSENIGIDLFENKIKEMFFHGEISFNDEIFITNMRHKEALLDARNSIRLVKNSVDMSMPEDFLSIDLMSAYTSLGYIIGEEIGEDLVNEIFQKFCMGK
ncbi:MAG: tRNA uridine-5-carboxymethylaminomethyl(34) synthesis GTPase MnmE [Lachnospiraceae bacterium]